jgi:thioredoxin-like negative regulator of GroEL
MNKERGIIYFSAPWCQPCKVLGPVIDSLISEGINVKKVNCDYDTLLTQKYGVKSIPTLVLTDLGGSELGRKTGAMTREQILNFYNG